MGNWLGVAEVPEKSEKERILCSVSRLFRAKKLHFSTQIPHLENEDKAYITELPWVLSGI